MRKPRSDSKLLNLPHAQQDELADWLLDGMSYAEAKERLHLDFCVECSPAALSVFYQQVCAPQRLRRAAEAANALPEAAGGLMANWNESSKALVRQRYFELLAAPVANPKELASFAAQIADIGRGEMDAQKLKTRRQETALRTRLKRKDQALSQAKFDALERRNAEARAKLNQMVETKGGLTPETVQQIEEALRLL